jgi:hypothetical protein
MMGICRTKGCEREGEEIKVHRGSWIVGVPNCRACGEPLARTAKASKEVRLRMLSMLRRPKP